MDNSKVIYEFEEYLLNERKLSKSTVYNYLKDIEHFLRVTGKKYDNTTETDVLSYVSKIQMDGYKNATANRKLSTIKTFYLFLVNHGYINNNPAFSISIHREDRKLPEILDYEEVEKLLSSPDINDDLGVRDRAILELMYGSGLKVGEITGLNIEDIDLEREYVICRKDRGIDRYIPLNSHSIESIDTYLKYSRHILLGDSVSNALFLNKFGKQLSRQAVWKSVKGYGIKAGIDKEINSTMLRHSFAVHMLKNGLDMDQIKEILGHKDISTTQIYREKKNKSIGLAFKKAHNRK